MTESVLSECTIRAVEARGTGELGEVASPFWTVVPSGAAGTHCLACEVGVGPGWAGQGARTSLRTVMSWWAKTSF